MGGATRHALLAGGIADGSRITVCQELWPHCGHVMYIRGWPAASQRMQPQSQTDFANPHEQRTSHERELASIDLVQRCGSTAVRARWIKLISIASFLMWWTRPDAFRSPNKKLSSTDH